MFILLLLSTVNQKNNYITKKVLTIVLFYSIGFKFFIEKSKIGALYVIAPDEIYTRIDPRNLYDEHAMKDRLISLTELNKERHEVDNITAVLIRVCLEE